MTDAELVNLAQYRYPALPEDNRPFLISIDTHKQKSICSI